MYIAIKGKSRKPSSRCARAKAKRAAKNRRRRARVKA